MVTEDQAREMMAAIKAFQLKDSNAERVRHNRKMAVAQSWFNALPEIVKNPRTRNDALANYKAIESMLKVEADSSKIAVLRKELSNANETFKVIKRAV